MPTPQQQLDAIKSQALALQASLAKGFDKPAPDYGTGGQANVLDTSLTDRLQKKLLGQNDIISSEASGIERLIDSSISGLERGQAARERGIAATYERQRNDLDKTYAGDFTARREGLANVGGASTYALMSQIEDDHVKSMRDLDLRETEALATGQIETASKIADLKLNQIQFVQKSRQDAFTNLLALGNFATSLQDQQLKVAQLNLSERQFGLSERVQDSNERQAMATIALNYGVTLNENDSIDTVVARATPFASQKQQLELQKLKADINASNAATAASLRSGQDVAANVDYAILATMYKNNPNDPYIASAFDRMTVQQKNNFLTAVNASNNVPKTDEELRSYAQMAKAGDGTNAGLSYDQAVLRVSTDTGIPNKDRAKLILSEIYGKAGKDVNKNQNAANAKNPNFPLTSGASKFDYNAPFPIGSLFKR